MNVSDRAIQAAKSVLAKCAANDPWFPQPFEAMILAWAEHISLCNLDVEDLLAGVTAVYREHGQGFKPLPADVITAARMVRHDRVQRESDAEREARQELNDQKTADRLAQEVRALAESKAIPSPSPEYKQPPVNPMTVKCPHPPCRGSLMRPCTGPNGRQLTRHPYYHPSRIEAVEKAAANAGHQTCGSEPGAGQ